MFQPQYEEYLLKNGIFRAIPVLLEAKHLKLGMEETRSFSLEGSLKLKNLFGYWETWDASVALELDRTTELRDGVEMPRIGAIPTPLMARISFLSGDWLKSSLKEHRREVDLQVALPLGVLNGALNAGVAAGIIHPLERGSTGSVLPLSERFYLGGNRSLVCRLGGPSSLSGFKARGLEPRDFRTCDQNNSENGASTSTELDGGGDIAVTAFADLSFDLPLKPLRELGIHGHAFVSAGNLAKLTEHDLQKFTPADFLQTFRSSVGFGVVVPTKLFRIEVCPFAFFSSSTEVSDEFAS
ncbi:unnamed protein product [Urochloa decumbens]|uniref:Bacterial surface antigen (D15) domain-containing protein n=1 Tax=Urochloa decumbens TaxID=240449 RepID=A0ABC9B3C5_9POAL